MKRQTHLQEDVYQLPSTQQKLHLVSSTETKTKLTLLLVHEFEQQLDQWVDIFDNDYTVKTAIDAIGALRIVLDEKVDLIISSAQLPDMSGLDVCKFVKQHVTTQHIQVIFVSEHYSEFEEEKALSLGAIDYISSDTSSNILFKRVKNHMKLVKRSKELEQVSKTDALTGLANRMSFDTQLKEEWQAAIRGESSVALIMIDIDNFKFYNDEFGHVKGDECLAQVAQCLARTKHRSKDFVARFGGEEFVMLLPFTDLEGAKKIAKNIVESVNNLNIPHSPKAQHRNVTISAGVTAYSPTYKNKTGLSLSDFIKNADTKLYQAKKYGRNKYCF
ncbi:diguanylate cyclase [Colwellia sp. UCD-KL20]|uniref:GGDEF domain-containing protein n=1 Tax=Colwellia sp. UCD-KL20 TaxID=1917165 RepID=UPI0009FA5588|nr:diguanylate cyclase [Colwellia sp. UCD-KL20]